MPNPPPNKLAASENDAVEVVMAVGGGGEVKEMSTMVGEEDPGVSNGTSAKSISSSSSANGDGSTATTVGSDAVTIAVAVAVASATGVVGTESLSDIRGSLLVGDDMICGGCRETASGVGTCDGMVPLEDVVVVAITCWTA
jgi:hypothetical protein